MNHHEYWEHYYRQHANPWTEPDEAVVQWAQQRPHSEKTGKAIDLGAGEGGNSIWLAENGWQVTSVEMASSAIEVIERESERRKLSIQTFAGDMRKLDLRASFDFILLSYIHFSPADRKALFHTWMPRLAAGGVWMYLGFWKDRDTLPEWADPEEFPHASQIASEMQMHENMVVLEASDTRKCIPVDHDQRYFEGSITKVIVKKEGF
ncbi:class I SAM-dependent methyltransferase [Marinicrinis sediminis]|uniref:Class I SAM-dependent methyltransferase n=1 Tax=Marinicrinis sediminis TaxID=1652465 RepID=A0ABW5R850_9BACL